MNEHRYLTSLRWTGNSCSGTSDYKAYSRNYEISIEGKPAPLLGSSDAHFRGDPAHYNPEELLVAALSSCHMLAYLHLCATHGVIVTAYEDQASGTMLLGPDGAGRFSAVILRPRVTLAAASSHATAMHLHEHAHHLCFIANSVNFPVQHEPAMIGAAPALN